MSRTRLLPATVALVLAGATTLAIAQDRTAVPASPEPPARISHRMGPLPPDLPVHRLHDAHRAMRGPDTGALSDLRELERLYRESGRSRELAALYDEVLAKSQDPMLRTYAYHHLARLQARPANVDQAIATLRKSLEENLADEAKRRQEREKMRALWEQRAARGAPSADPH